MSLMKTVTKMAIGFAMAKGMDAVQERGGISNVLGGLTGGGDGAASGGAAQQTGGMGGLSDIMGQLGGGGAAGASGSGGLGGLLGGLTGGAAGSSGGGMGDMLSQLTGGSGGGGAAAAGGLGGLGALLGGLAGARGGSGGLEALLNQDNPAAEPDEEEVAVLMLRAMTQAARADGEVDPQERESLIELLRSGDPDNVQLVQDIMSQPVDPAALAADTPAGLETQVYTMSVNAITPNNQAEAAYLHTLAEALGISPETANQIHDGIGAPRLYR